VRLEHGGELERALEFTEVRNVAVISLITATCVGLLAESDQR